MDQNILVTYATKYGATAEIAAKIGEVIRQTGFQTTVMAVEDVKDLHTYQVVILGSAVYIGKWQKAAERFLKDNKTILADRPLWLFSSGPTGEGDPLELVEGQRLPTALQPLADRIHPRDVAVFGGFINPDKVNFFERWVIKALVKKPIGDYRDWDRIVAWSKQIAEGLGKSQISQ